MVIEFQIGSLLYMFEAIVWESEAEGWEVFFKLAKDMETHKNYYSTDITGTGNAIGVLSAVHECLKLFLSFYHPKTFYFMASKEERSRIKLYDRLAKVIATRYKYVLTTKQGGDGTYYTFTKK
jgi:hypothetical protein